MSESTDLSPWAHPKAQQWFHDLIEDNMFALGLDDELARAEHKKEFDSIRAILALAILLGRDGIWPANRTGILQAIVRCASKSSKSDAPHVGDRPLTVAEHQRHARHDQAVKQETEFLRRRLKMSNRKSALKPPVSWGNLWE